MAKISQFTYYDVAQVVFTKNIYMPDASSSQKPATRPCKERGLRTERCSCLTLYFHNRKIHYRHCSIYWALAFMPRLCTNILYLTLHFLLLCKTKLWTIFVFRDAGISSPKFWWISMAFVLLNRLPIHLSLTGIPVVSLANGKASGTTMNNEYIDLIHVMFYELFTLQTKDTFFVRHISLLLFS